MKANSCKDIYFEHDLYTYGVDNGNDAPPGYYQKLVEEGERLAKERIVNEKRRIKDANSNVKCERCDYRWKTKSKSKYLTCAFCKNCFRNPHYNPKMYLNDNDAKFIREFEAETIRLENLKRQRLGLGLTLPGTNSNSNNNVPRPKRRSRIVG